MERLCPPRRVAALVAAVAIAALALGAVQTAAAGAEVQLATGWDFTCAIPDDGSLVCWGIRTGIAPSDRFKSVSAGTETACAIRTDDTPACWGRNAEGQATIPPGLGTVKAIAVGGPHTCAIKSDDTVACGATTATGR